MAALGPAGDDRKAGVADVCVVPLGTRPGLAADVAALCYPEWRGEYAAYGVHSLDACAAELRSDYMSTAADAPQLAFVALSPRTGELLATVTLGREDLPPRPHVTPWVMCLVVRPPWRGVGLVSVLLDAVVAHARRVGVPTLHLWAKEAHAGIYARRGFVEVEALEYLGQRIVVMAMPLRD